MLPRTHPVEVFLLFIFSLPQGSAIEVMLLRTALRYDKEQDAIMFGNEQPYTRKQLQEGGIGDLVDPMYNFARSMSELDLDYAEYVLLMAITILSSGEKLTHSFDLKKKKNHHFMPVRGVFSGHNPKLFRLDLPLVDHWPLTETFIGYDCKNVPLPKIMAKSRSW